MRVFLAIDLPEPVRAELESLQDFLSIGRLVPSDNFHLTLSFLGEQPDDAIEDAHKALSGIRADAFGMELVGTGSFGRRTPQVICAVAPRIPELMELQRRVTRALRRAGLDFQKRRFRPHVTIARLPKHLSPFELAQVRDFLAENAAFRSSCFDVGCFQLYRSILTTRTALHDVLASYRLMET